jgi:cell division protein ZapA
MKGQNIVSISILGSEYKIKGDSDPEHIRNVASLVDLKMRELEDKGVSPKNIAILAALNIADEYLRYQGSIKGKVERLHSLLEKKLEDT